MVTYILNQFCTVFAAMTIGAIIGAFGLYKYMDTRNLEVKDITNLLYETEENGELE